MNATALLLDLVEDVRATTPLKVDRQKGTISDVKLLGWRSQNGREYDPAGVREALYEGRRINANHPGKPNESRSVYDTIAWVEGAYKQPDGVYARQIVLLNPSGEFEQRVMTAAEKAPHLFGLSHCAQGREKPGSKGAVIESVESVLSIDLVADPATTRGLFESRNPTVPKTIKEIKAAQPADSRGRQLLQLLEDAGMGDTPMPDDAPANPTDARMLLAQACGLLVQSADSADHDLAMKIMKLLKPDNPTPAPADATAAESRTHTQPDDPAVKELQESLRLLREESAVRDLIEEAGLTFATPAGRKTFVKSLLALTEAERKELIEERQARPKPQDPPTEPRPKPAPPPRPRSAPPDTVRESKAAADPLAVPAGDRKAVMAWLKE